MVTPVVMDPLSAEAYIHALFKYVLDRKSTSEKEVRDWTELVLSGYSPADVLRLFATCDENTIRKAESKNELIQRSHNISMHSDEFPVFILGSKRSGTSVVALGLLHSGRYQGRGEGYLLHLIPHLNKVVHSYFQMNMTSDGQDTTIRAVSEMYMQRAINAIFLQITRMLFPTGFWLDKTPNAAMVRAAPAMLELWPTAKFIFMKRRAVENVASRLRKFPNETFETHCNDWAEVMESWISIREELLGSSLEIEHQNMVNNPQDIAKSICDFLEVPSEQAAIFCNYLISQRPEQTDPAFGAVRSPEELGWTTDQLKLFHRKCGPWMRAFGYDEGESYFQL